jgi:PAS domain S-box-containing protein
MAAGELTGPSFGENVTKDGRRFLSEWTNTRLTKPDGSFAGLLSACVDVTERTRAMHALEHSEQRYRSLIECLPDAILVTRGATLTFANAAAVELFEATSAAELVGKFVAELMHQDSRHLVSATGDITRASRLQRAELLSLRGRQIFGEVAAIPLADDPGAPGSLIVVRDLTERDALERELRQKQKLEILGQLAGGIAHDFNNVLGVILSACSLLADRKLDDPKAVEEVEFIRDAAERAAALTGQLLAFARRQNVAPRVFDLNELACQARLLLERLLGEDIAIEFELEQSLMSVKADPRQIEQVIVNLAANARAAMPRGGRLTLATRNVDFAPTREVDRPSVKSGQFVELSVRDTGIGMDHETLERIFEPFFTTKQTGAGLGLVTCYGIVTHAGGYIHAQSEPGRGALFRVFLPAATEVQPERTSSQELTPASSGSETILVVDDNVPLRIVTVRILEQAGYRVLQAALAAEATERFRELDGAVDILLTDVIMPGMSGPELAARLVSELPTLRVIYMSGYADDLPEIHGVVIPNSDFLQKPFTPRVLLEHVRRSLDERGRSPTFGK